MAGQLLTSLGVWLITPPKREDPSYMWREGRRLKDECNCDTPHVNIKSCDYHVISYQHDTDPGMSRDHFWSICTYPFSTNVGLNGRLLVPNLVDLVSL